MKLVFARSGLVVSVGMVVKDFRGDMVVITGMEEPKHDASTGRIYVKDVDHQDMPAWRFFPSVIDAHWIDDNATLQGEIK